MSTLLDGTFDPKIIIGRSAEREAVDTAIRQRGRRCFYFEGFGGIGKTYLLRSVVDSLQQMENLPQDVLKTNIIDLYHVRYHQPLALLGELANRIRADGLKDSPDPFAGFGQAVNAYYRARGSTNERSSYQNVEQAFLIDYTQLAQRYRILVTIDTLEKLDFSIDEQIDEQDNAPDRFDQWLFELLEQLPNTVVILAGRPRPRQQQLLEITFGPACKIFPIQPFTPDETRAYTEQIIRQSGRAITLEAQEYDRVFDITQGEPIPLILYLSYLLAQPELRELPNVFGDNHDKTVLHTAFRDAVIGELQAHSVEIHWLLEYAVFLRKGIDAQILHQLEPNIPEADLRKWLGQFQQMPIVKTTNADRVILHDEVYDLLFEQPGIASIEKFGQKCFERITAYLKTKLHQIRKEIREAQSPSPQQFQDLQVTQLEYLFYKMAIDPIAGYQDYRELALSTIIDRDADYDRQLQGELARFFDLRISASPADPQSSWGRYYVGQLKQKNITTRHLAYDQRVFAVYRALNFARGPQAERIAQARHVAATVRQAYHDVYQPNPIEQAMLDVAELEARVFDASEDPIAIREAYETVTNALKSDGEQHFAMLLRALAYNTRGFFERITQNTHTAIQHYSEAIKLFQQLEQEADKLRAVTLTNLGFALNLQGKQELGRIVAERALTIFTEVGSEFSAALTRNVLARILLELDQVEQALLNVQQARAVLEGFGQTRELGLCAYAEGDIRRWYAHAKGANYDASHAEYERAINRYEEAKDIFEKGGERIRQIEVLQGLGCAYRSRAHLHRSYAKHTEAEQDTQAALTYFEKALERFAETEQTPLKTGILEDIAVCFVDQEQYDEAMQRLHQAEESIPADFNVHEDTGTQGNPDATREDRSFWLQRGQIELQKGLCAFGQFKYKEFCESILRAFGCILEFAPQSRQVITIRMLTHERIMQIPTEHANTLREDTRQYSRKFKLEAAWEELAPLFDEWSEYGKLLGQP